MEHAVEVEAVGRTFPISGGKQLQALEDVSFVVGLGEVVGLLGVNGAGKTTLTKILATLLLPSSGAALVMGYDVAADTRGVRTSMSVILGGDRGLYNRISGRENLAFFGMLAGVSRRDLGERIPLVLDQVNLADAADRRVETYSKGMRQRLHVAIGLLSRPQVLLLDEPTVGLDPLEADRLRETIHQLRREGTSILLTSHLLLDVERLADRVVMLDKGRVTADLPLRKFAGLAGYAAVVTLTYRGALDLARSLPAGAAVDRHTHEGELSTLVLKLREWSGDLFGALGRLVDDVQIQDIDVRPARLEEAFATLSARRP
ncbi:N/A [soil metagenome]